MATTVTANTNLVLVNTADNPNTVVNLPGGLNVGQIITIRDNQGAASSSNIITITPVGGAIFDTGVALPDGLKIRQPFGAVTVSYTGVKNMGGGNIQPVWNILNTFAFANPIFGSVDAMTVSSITFRDTVTGNNSLLSVNNNQFRRDGSLVAPPPTNWASFGANNHVNMCNYNINNVSNINVSNILTVNNVNVTGGVNMNSNTITNLSNLSMVGTLRINGNIVTPGGGGGSPSNWATYPATDNVDINNKNIINVSNINAQSYSLNGQPFTGGGGGSPSNWATYLANHEVDMSNNNIINASNITLNGTLTIGETVFTGEGAAPTNWASYPATQDLNMSNNNIINASNITLTGILTIGGTAFTGEGAVATPSNWASYPATQDLNMSNYNISNILNIDAQSYSLNGEPFTGSGGSPSNWAEYAATQDLNMSNNSIINACNITLNGTLTIGATVFTGEGAAPTNWASYAAISNVDINYNSIINISNISFGSNNVPQTIINVASSTYIYTSLNGNLTTFDFDPEQIYTIYHHGGLWIAGGDTGGYTYYSSNAITWTKNDDFTFTNAPIINAITYGDGKWVAFSDANAGGTISWSIDGKIWDQISLIDTSLYCGAYNGSYWILGGDFGDSINLRQCPNIIGNEFDPIETGGFSASATKVLYGNNIWVAIGNDANFDSIQYSINGLDWIVAYNLTTDETGNFFSGKVPGALSYGNGHWLAGGGNLIYGSSDGSNFSNYYTAPTGTQIQTITYVTDSTFYATCTNDGTNNTLIKSTDNGLTWLSNYTFLFNTDIRDTSIVYISPNVNTLIEKNTITTTTINATQINTSNLNLMGAPLSISSCNLLLYNSKPVNPVGAYIEIHSPASYFVTYPLYTGSTGISVDPTVENGLRAWWNTTLVDDSCVFSGITLLPNYNIKYDVDPLTIGSSNITNTSMFPIYIDLTPASVTGTLYYNLTPV